MLNLSLWLPSRTFMQKTSFTLDPNAAAFPFSSNTDTHVLLRDDGGMKNALDPIYGYF